MACRVNVVALSRSHCAPERCGQKTIKAIAEALVYLLTSRGERKYGVMQNVDLKLIVICMTIVKEEVKGNRSGLLFR